eukprot:scaffold21180_cov31-Tisochrysis_lutea.AAC.3
MEQPGSRPFGDNAKRADSKWKSGCLAWNMSTGCDTSPCSFRIQRCDDDREMRVSYGNIFKLTSADAHARS